jgi:hypothetical protein
MKSSHGRRSSSIWSAVAVTAATAVLGAIGVAVVLYAGAPAAGSTYQVKTVRLASGAQTVARWNPCQKAITWQANLKGLKAAQRTVMLAQFKSAFIRLSRANGMTYRYTGKTPFIPRKANLVNQPADIVLATVPTTQTDLNFSERSLGFGGVLWATWYGSSGEGAAVVRGYVVLPPSGLAKLRPGFGAGKTQGDVILHELGHATGLDHVSSKSALMYPVLTTGAPNGYAKGDLAGLAKLGTKPGCITIPSRVNIKDYD